MANSWYMRTIQPIPKNPNYIQIANDFGEYSGTYSQAPLFKVNPTIPGDYSSCDGDYDNGTQNIGTLPKGSKWETFIISAYGAKAMYNLGGNQWTYSVLISGPDSMPQLHSLGYIPESKVNFAN